MLASHPDGNVLAHVALADDRPEFALSYVHSVTRTPVTESYHATGDELVETEIRFTQHGPGLPTEADAGSSFTVRDGEFVVTMQRHFRAIVMQVHADQSPRLAADSRSLDLAQWGNRALTLGVATGPCAGP